MPGSTNSSESPDPRLWITILAGGSGTRFWPASTPKRPKQLLPLASEQALILDTLDRARALVPDQRIRILTGEHLLAPFSEILQDPDPEIFLVEPQAKGTAPILVWASWVISQVDPQAVMTSFHADHAIYPMDAFLELIAAGAEAAISTGALFTIAVPPSRPETGYGYIQPGDPIPLSGDGEAFRVRSFKEKPDVETAQEFVDSGYLWNSGIFLWSVSAFLNEVRDVAPEIGDLIPLLEAGDVEGFFREAPAISIDNAVLERSRNVATVKATFQWDDVGTWDALARTRPQGERGNVLHGDVHAVESADNIVMAEDGTVVLFGVQNLAVVRRGDIVLVAERDKTPDLKSLLEKLPPELRDPDQ